MARHRAPAPHAGYTTGLLLLIVGTLATLVAPLLDVAGIVAA